MEATGTLENRVTESTAGPVNAHLAETVEERLAYFAAHPERIDDRLAELGREWDVERMLQLNASSLSIIGLALGAFVDRRLLAVSAIVGGFLLQHSIQGWCPPLPLFRRMGLRTRDEILQEYYALRALRGDFRNLQKGPGKKLDAWARKVYRAFDASTPPPALPEGGE